jgi:predicted RNase H-like HicB family nuclease
MAHYIALIHKDRDSCYGVSFPDLPGVFTAADSIDEAMQKAAEVIEFAAEDWSDLTGEGFPPPGQSTNCGRTRPFRNWPPMRWWPPFPSTPGGKLLPD